MRTGRLRFLVGFLAGTLTAALVVFSTGGASGLAAARYQDLSLFAGVLKLVRENYVEEVDETKLVRGAVRGMLQDLDPHSSYLDPESHKEMQVDTRGEFHGLGIEIMKRRDGFIEVVAPIDGTPASRAGVRAKDEIVAICPTERPKDWTEPCRNTKGMDLHEAVLLMRGPRGSKITIHILREGFEKPEPYTIVRDVVKVESVEAKMLEPGFVYARIRSFQEHTAEDLKHKLEDLRQKAGGSFQGFVLDLRDDPGGLLDQAVKVADLWLSDGLIVYTQGRVESQRQEFRARPEGEGPSYPMVVLVNSGTASASEIVAGALQDQKRALVLGTSTFGKGSVQTVYPLEDGSGLRLTTALYYTPAGRSIQAVGIAPDIVVEQPAEALVPDEAEAAPRALRERDLEGHFETPGRAPGKAPEAAPEEPARPGEPRAEGPRDDVQLARAVEVLKSWTYFERLRGPDAGPAQAKAPAPRAALGGASPADATP
jgi:carboxyl-terminal processing protease